VRIHEERRLVCGRVRHVDISEDVDVSIDVSVFVSIPEVGRRVGLGRRVFDHGLYVGISSPVLNATTAEPHGHHASWGRFLAGSDERVVGLGMERRGREVLTLWWIVS
jgi:hypothetical protein